MSTVTFTFDMPEDREEFSHAYHGLDWALVCWDLHTKLRNLLKYGDHKHDDATLEYLQDTLFEIMDDHGVDLDMIT